MKSLFFGFLTLCIWAIPVRYYYVCKIKNLCDNSTTEQVATPKERTKTLQLTLGDSILLKDYEQFYFSPSSAQAALSDNNMAFIREVAEQLLADSLQLLSVTAFYRPSERDIRQGYFENLGMARANALKELLNQQGVEDQQIRLEAEETTEEAMLDAAKFNLFYSAEPDSTQL
ncbi:MAG: hypothetical protein AAF990_05655 [Bacteroidota bacterium]